VKISKNKNHGMGGGFGYVHQLYGNGAFEVWESR